MLFSAICHADSDVVVLFTRITSSMSIYTTFPFAYIAQKLSSRRCGTSPEHRLLITINRGNFILFWGSEINRKYWFQSRKKSIEKSRFSKVKINREFLHFSSFFTFFSTFLLIFLLILKVRLWCETSMPRTFCKGVWSDLFAMVRHHHLPRCRMLKVLWCTRDVTKFDTLPSASGIILLF